MNAAYASTVSDHDAAKLAIYTNIIAKRPRYDDHGKEIPEAEYT